MTDENLAKLKSLITMKYSNADENLMAEESFRLKNRIIDKNWWFISENNRSSIKTIFFATLKYKAIQIINNGKDYSNWAL